MADALCFRLRTRKEQALSVAARWRDQYMRDDRDKGWRFSDGRTTNSIPTAVRVVVSRPFERLYAEATR